MKLVADGAPLIFLAKINQLQLLKTLFKAEILVPSVVVDEVLCEGRPPDEERLLKAFLTGCRILKLKKPDSFASALSSADNCILTLSFREKAEIVLSDDKLLRKIALIERFRVIGTLGILIQARKSNQLNPQDAAELLDELVRDHNFRISTRVYAAARSAILQEDNFTG
ncbi:DUF3368 domain-containing protein [Thermodesulfobacteriota bacterium]